MRIVKLRPFLIFAALPLLGCANTERALCPSVSLLSDTAQVTVFRSGAPHDPSGEAFTTAMTGAAGTCHYNRGAPEIPTDVSFTVQAVRAPSPDGGTYSVPYYVAVTQADRILSKTIYNLDINFAPGSANTRRDVSLDTITLHLEEGHPATDYQVLVGFQLSDADRAYNQTRGRYAP